MNRFYVLLPLLFLAIGLNAQPDRYQKFAAAAYLGANFSQIHGDNLFGYNQVGLRFGIETHYLLQPKYFISVGIGFSAEGASPDQDEINFRGGNAVVLRLNMVEIPLLFNYRLGDAKATGKRNNHALYRSTILQLGLKVTRLTGFRTANRGFFDQLLTNPPYTLAEIEFQDFDFAVVGGVTLQMGLKTAVFIQHSMSLRGLYRPEDVETAFAAGFEVFQLRPYALTVGAKIVLY